MNEKPPPGGFLLLTSSPHGDEIQPMIFRIAIAVTILFALLVGYKAYRLYETSHALSAMFEAGAPTAIGPENADLTVVKFMDYACIYCRNVHPELMKAVTEDGNVRLIIRPLPSKSADGSSFGRLAYATASLGKFEQSHDFMVQNFGPLDEALIDKLAAAIGVEADTIHQAYENPDIASEIDRNMGFFRAVGGVATPTFFIGPEIVFIPAGKMPLAADFKTMFTQARDVKP